MIDYDALYWACKHLIHADKANACIHTAPVRYSPLTFRLVQLLVALEPDYQASDEISEVLRHLGSYDQDMGR